MNADLNRKSSSSLATRARLLRAGTALPLLLAAWPAIADPIVENSSSDISVDADSASGTPVAVELSSTGGSIQVSVDTVSGTSAVGVRDYIVGLETQTDGSITGIFDSIVGTGDGEVLGLGATTRAGDISLDVGSVDVDGTATAGIAAYTNDGDVMIGADTVIARGTGLDSQEEFLEAVAGVSDTGSVTIDVGTAESFGTYGSAIVAIAGDVATVTVDSATIHYADTVAVYASGANGAHVEAASVTDTSDTGRGVFVGSSSGDASLTAGTIVVGDFAQGARLQAAGAITADVASISGGTGLRANSTSGDVSITVGNVDTFSYAVNASTAAGGNLAIAAGRASSSIEDTATIVAEVQGGGAIAIEVGEASGAGVDRGTVVATTDSGDISIQGGTISASGDGGLGILARSTDGDIAVEVESVATTGLQMVDGHASEGAYAETINGTANVTVGSASAEGYAASAAIAIGGAGASVTAENASSAGQFAAILYASSSAGDAAVDAGTVTMRGDQQGAINALADHGHASVTVDSILNDGTSAVGVFARGGNGASVTSGTISVDRRAVWADALNGSAASIVTTGNTTVSAGYGLRATGGSVSISTGAGTTTSASGNALWAQSSQTATIVNGGTVIATGDLGSAIHVTAPGAVSITSEVVEVTGVGAWPGERSDGSGLRLEQGGIIVEGGAGAIAIDAGTVDIEGEHRYGISARGTGAISIAVDSVNLASPDAAAVAARGGEGDVSITTGTIITTGASGTGLVAETTSGNISIDTGTIRIENDGMAGPFTGEAIYAESGSGTVTIAAADTFSAAYGGSAAVGISGGDVSIVSANVETTGENGIAIYAQSTAGDASVETGTVAVTGPRSMAVAVYADTGTASMRVSDVTVSGEGGLGVIARGLVADVAVDGTISSTGRAVLASGAAETHVLINGAVTSTVGVGVVSRSNHGVVEVAEGASVAGHTTGVALVGSPEGGFTEFYNSGSVRSETGPAVLGSASTPGGAAADFYIQNNGTLIAGGDFAVVTEAGDDTLELTNLSIIDGIADLGEGDDRLVLDFNDDAPAGAVGQVVSTINVEGLSVDSGSWRAEGVQSEYDFVEIEDGATLTVVENEQGSLAVEAASVELDGVLNLDLSVDETEGDLGETTITGIGSLHLIGTATVELTDATGLQHTGGTFVENGELLLETVYGGDITTSGEGVFELGAAGDFTGNLVNDGTFVFSRGSDYSFLGDFSGSGLLRKDGDSTLTFAGLYAFEGTTSVLGGSVAFTGQLSEDTELDLTEGTVDLSQVEGGEQTIGELQGTGGTLQLGQTQLVIEQMGNTVFAGEILGLGTLLKEGEGDLKLNGDGTGFTGTGEVGGGTLSVNGNFGNANFEVNEGGTLGGAGTVGATNVNGGTLAPGNSIDTLTVNGNVTFTAASVYEVEVDAAGNSDRLNATGTATLGGARVEVIAENAIYRPQTDYTVLTAAGGISGTFGSVLDNLAFLDSSLSYSANAVTLRLVRNDIDFAAFGATANQVAVGGLIESLGFGNALYDATLTLADSNVAVSFASLTGDVYPAYGAAMIETAEVLRRQTADAAKGEGTFAWATGLYNSVDSGSGEGNIELLGKGAAGGFGYGAGGFSATAGVGLLDQDRGGSEFRDGEVTFAIGRLGWNGLGGLAVGAGAQFGWVDGQARRQTTLGTIDQAVTGEIEGDYVQLFGELAYRMPVGGGFVAEPFAGVSHVSLDLDGVTETGAPTALAVAAIDRKVTFADIGLRVSGDAATGLRPFASAAYRHAWGDRASVAAFGFAGLAGTALVGAVPIAKSAAELSAGVMVTRGMIDFELGYDATISEAFDSHGVSAGFKARF